MQFDSAARLAHLESLHKAKSAAARDAQRRRNDIAATATAARGEAARAEAEAEREKAAGRMGLSLAERMAEKAIVPSDRSKSTIDTDDRAAKAARLRARADELDAALAEADATAALTRDAATDAGRVLAAATDFARANRLPMPVAITVTGADPLAHVQSQGAFR